MHFLLPICGKFTRALLAHQIFCFHILSSKASSKNSLVFKIRLFWPSFSAQLYKKYTGLESILNLIIFCLQNFAKISLHPFFYFQVFNLPHMKYEGSIGFVMRKMKFFIADFHVFGLFMAKNMI
jgi:hypothetical protein